MTGETPFRIAVAAVLVLTMAVGVPFRLRAARSGGPVSHREEGYVFATALRLGGVAMWIGTFMFLFTPESLRWAYFSIPTPLRWGAAGTGLLGVGMVLWTFSHLGKNLTDTVTTRPNASLVTDGPYRWVRHPFYVAAALLIGSVTLVSSSGLIGVGGLFVLVLLAIRTPLEEQMLVARFGDAYRDYAAVTGRYWPRLGRRG